MPKTSNAVFRVVRISDGHILACCETEDEVKRLIDEHSRHYMVGVEGFEPMYVEDPVYGKELKLFHLSYKPYQA